MKSLNKIKVYEKPTCTTCRKVAKAFSELGVDFEKINYYIDPFTKPKLKSLLTKMKMKQSELLHKIFLRDIILLKISKGKVTGENSAAQLLRKNDEAFKKLKSLIEKLDENEILDLMIKNPDLVQRPIIENSDKAILARPPERIKEII